MVYFLIIIINKGGKGMARWYHNGTTTTLGDKLCAFIGGFGWVILRCVEEGGTKYTIETYSGDVLGSENSLEAAEQWVKENIGE